MRALDTNVLVRFLTNDDSVQASQVYRFFRQLTDTGERVWVSTVVVLELCWVLKTGYCLSRAEVIDAVDDLIMLPLLKFEHETAVQSFLHEARSINVDLSDLLIAHIAQNLGSRCVLTFDRKALRCSLFQAVPDVR